MSQLTLKVVLASIWEGFGCEPGKPTSYKYSTVT